MTIVRTVGIAIQNGRQHDQWSEVRLPCEVSRDPQKVVVHPARENSQLVKLLRLEAQSEDDPSWLVVTCFESTILADGRRLTAGQTTSLQLPIALFVDESKIELFSADRDYTFDSMSEIPIWLDGNHRKTVASRQAIPKPPSAELLVEWFSSLGRLHRTVAGSEEFFKQACKSVFDPGGLDVGMILLKRGDLWNIESSYVPRGDFSINFDSKLVEMAAERKTTLFHDSTKTQNGSRQSLVASPILDSAKDCIGMVYCVRESHQRNHRSGIRPLEAQFVSLIADTISSALHRFSLETEAARTQVLLEQAFPPSVAQSLRKDDSILEPRQTETTILFCDIRNFTQIAQRQSAKLVYEFLADLMERFTKIVMGHQGVVIDYFGDGFSAFWNAPIAQYDHPRLACEAASSIQNSIQQINEQWQPIFDAEIKVGVGIHTTLAIVGNSGSNRRIKYGPRGTEVAVAERLQSVTKSVGVPIIVSEATALRVTDDFFPVRIGAMQLKGFGEDRELFCLFDADCPAGTMMAAQHYERALDHASNGRWEDAESALEDCRKVSDEFPLIAYLNDQLKQKVLAATHP